MSQEKVDRYKEQKANRKKLMRKEKLMNALRKCAVGLVGIILIGWIGYSAYGTYERNKPKEEVEINYTAMTEFQQNLSSLGAEAAE